MLPGIYRLTNLTRAALKLLKSQFDTRLERRGSDLMTLSSCGCPMAVVSEVGRRQLQSPGRHTRATRTAVGNRRSGYRSAERTCLERPSRAELGDCYGNTVIRWTSMPSPAPADSWPQPSLSAATHPGRSAVYKRVKIAAHKGIGCQIYDCARPSQ